MICKKVVASPLWRRPRPSVKRSKERVGILEAEQEGYLSTAQGRSPQVVLRQSLPRAIENRLKSRSLRSETALQGSRAGAELLGNRV